MAFLKKIHKKRHVFADHAAGTPIDKKVSRTMEPFLDDLFYNPGAIYAEGFEIRDYLNEARKKIAKNLAVRAQEIIFCDGGTEANNLAIRGLVSRYSEDHDHVPHIIISEIEHASVLETCYDLKRRGLIELDLVSVDEQGLVNLKELKKNIKENTILVSVGYVNGEIGVIQDIKSIMKTIRHYRKHHQSNFPYFHTDAVQAVNYLDINMQKLGVDLMTLNSSKVYGPKKIAVLYKKSNIEINPIITGGSQEFGLRAGTENVAAIVGCVESVGLAQSLVEKEDARLRPLRDYFEQELKSLFSDILINAEQAERIPNITNISFPDISSEELVLRLDAFGIKASVKSACKSGEEGDSHVIRALRDYQTQSIRFSFGRQTEKKDIDYILGKMEYIVLKMKQSFDTYIKNR